MRRSRTREARPALVGPFCFLVLAFGLVGCADGADEPQLPELPVASPVVETRTFREFEDFLSGGYWDRPIPAQGPAPEQWSSLEASLSPEQCGTCHVDQYADWQTTIHAHAYSPGLSGQLVSRRDFTFARSCLRCHAPLSEQQAQLPLPAGGFGSNPDFDSALKEHGIVCAACHVRGNTRHGPPTRDGSIAPSEEGMPHGGVIRTEYFEDSRFCSGCHQFASPAANGKSLQNTYQEWESSRYAAEGRSCQSCHMPDRRHLWRGIHDPDMVRSGVTIAWQPAGTSGRLGLRVTNTGTGHRFPTYVTPAVDVSIEFLDADRKEIAGAGAVGTITRVVSRQDGVWIESSDTRIAPDSSFLVAGEVPPGAAFARGSVLVRPDAFYRNVFAGLLAGNLSDTSRVLIDAAHESTLASPFTIFDDTLAIQP